MKKIKIRCPVCHVVNRIPYDEFSFRVDDYNVTVCWKCCKELNWEMPNCMKCSDRVLCSGQWKKAISEETK